MEIIISGTYESLSQRVATDLKQLVALKKDPLICTASGDTPSGLYKELVSLANKNELDTSAWNFVGLDEWAGMNGTDEGSCRFYLDEQLFIPLQVTAKRICFFNGRAGDPQKECKDTEDFIQKHHGIDVAILGLGINGHAGMNEPGTSAKLHSHVADIDPVTQKTGQKYFKEEKELTQGITLGLATISEAKHIFLLVSGSHKAQIIKRVLEEEISELLPASILRTHPGLRIYLDSQAAALINAE